MPDTLQQYRKNGRATNKKKTVSENKKLETQNRNEKKKQHTNIFKLVGIKPIFSARRTQTQRRQIDKKKPNTTTMYVLYTFTGEASNEKNTEKPTVHQYYYVLYTYYI